MIHLTGKLAQSPSERNATTVADLPGVISSRLESDHQDDRIYDLPGIRQNERPGIAE
jgi:hypothetical protein